MAESKLERVFSVHLRSLDIEYEQEYRFSAIHAGGIGKGVRARLANVGLKDWRFDFAFPRLMLAIELEGGVYTGGRHTRGKGFEDDCNKYNAALLLGWRVLRFTGGMVKSGEALTKTEQMIERIKNVT